MRAIRYVRASGFVVGGCEASSEADLLAQATPEIGVLISDADWASVAVDTSDPENPVVVSLEAPSQ